MPRTIPSAPRITSLSVSIPRKQATDDAQYRMHPVQDNLNVRTNEKQHGSPSDDVLGLLPEPALPLTKAERACRVKNADRTWSSLAVLRD